MNCVPLLSTVALIQDLPELGLTQGQIGVVVEYLEREGEQALLVEFSDGQGRTYAMLDLKPDQVLVLHRNIAAA
jgi:hypothetical protein